MIYDPASMPAGALVTKTILIPGNVGQRSTTDP